MTASSLTPTINFHSPSIGTVSPSTPRSPLPSKETQKACSSSSNGDYGIETASSVYVQYNYQIQVPQTINVGQVISKLERKVTDLILPSLFSGKCASTNQRKLASSALEVVGVSALPDDIATGTLNAVGPLRTHTHLLIEYSIFFEKYQTIACMFLQEYAAMMSKGA